jgi:hypothetical protein
MTKVRAAVIASLLVQIAATAAVAQQKVPDVSGWQNLRWGMTEDEVHSALAGEQLIQLSPSHSYEMPDDWIGPKEKMYATFKIVIQLSNFKADAIPQFGRETQRLERVGIRNSFLESYSTFRDLLSEKYGSPRTTGGPLGNSLVWRFKTTTITLGRVDTQLVRFVSVVYVPTNRLRDDRGDKDKL